MIELEFRPEKKDLRVFSILLVLLSPLIGWFVSHYVGGSQLAWWIAGVLSVIGVAGLIVPSAISWFYVSWMVLVFPIGWLISHFLLALVFWGLFWPVGAALKLFGHDPLQVKPVNRESYWDDLEKAESQEQYFRQF